MARLTGMDAVADSGGFLVVYPDGIDRGWNDGRGINEGIDDVGFTREMVSKLETQYKIDGKRVFATGISNGGFMCFRLACDAPDLVAAVAPVAAAMSDALAKNNRSTAPVSVLVINGTADPFVPWNGGVIGSTAGGRGIALSAQATIGYWVALDGCPATPVVSGLPDTDPADGTRVTQSSYGGGRGGTGVVLLAVDGGGHAWPGGRQYLPVRVIGRTSRDVTASQYIWEFFKGHPKR